MLKYQALCILNLLAFGKDPDRWKPELVKKKAKGNWISKDTFVKETKKEALVLGTEIENNMKGKFSDVVNPVTNMT
jgi:hypothetical protein